MSFFGVPTAQYNAAIAKCEGIARQQLGAEYNEWAECVRPRLLALALVPELYVWHIREVRERGKLIAALGPITYSEVCSVFIVHDRDRKTICSPETFTGAAVFIMLRQLAMVNVNRRLDIEDFATHEQIFRITDEILRNDSKEETAERTLFLSTLMMIGSRLIHVQAACSTKSRFSYPLDFSMN